MVNVYRCVEPSCRRSSGISCTVEVSKDCPIPMMCPIKEHIRVPFTLVGATTRTDKIEAPRKIKKPKVKRKPRTPLNKRI